MWHHMDFNLVWAVIEGGILLNSGLLNLASCPAKMDFEVGKSEVTHLADRGHWKVVVNF